MEQELYENKAVASFDTIYTNNHIRILKVLLPYFDPNSQKKLAIMIKFMELRYTMDYFSRHAPAFSNDPDSFSRQPDIVRIFEQIKNFCTPSERAMFEQLANMKKSMEMYEEMMGMMQLFNQFSDSGAADPASEPSKAEDTNGAPFGGGNPMDMLKGMLSPEQQAMFDMFQSSFGNTTD